MKRSFINFSSRSRGKRRGAGAGDYIALGTAFFNFGSAVASLFKVKEERRLQEVEYAQYVAEKNDRLPVASERVLASLPVANAALRAPRAPRAPRASPGIRAPSVN